MTSDVSNSLKASVLVSLLCANLMACAGAVPTAEEMAADDHRSQVEQILRVAESTRAGGDLASAVGLYRRAHLLAPERADALVEMGRTQFELGAIADSAQAFTKAIRLEPGSGAARYGLGKSLTALNKPRDAAEQFRHAVAIEPANPDHHNGLGVALDYASDHPAAQQAYINGLEINPDDIKLRSSMTLFAAVDDPGGAFAQVLDKYFDGQPDEATVQRL